MKKQNGFSQIVIMVVMLILAIALPVTANLVKKVQDNRSSAAAEYCSAHYATRCVSGKLQTCEFSTELIPAKLVWTSSSTACGCTSKGGACVTSYTGMSSGITCSGSTGGTNGGTTNTSLSCGSGQVCCVPNSPGNTSGSAGTGSGAEACVAKGGACQTNGGGSAPAVGSACTVNGKTGTSQANLCVGQYNSGYRCCVPGSTPDPVAPAPVVPAPGCTATTGSNGSCGAAAGTMHWLTGTGTAPTTTNLITQNPLCADGSKPTVNTNADYTYTWTCGGGAGTCGGANGGTASCTAYWLNCNDLNYWAMYPDVKDAGWRPYLHYTTVHASEPGRTWPTSGSTPFCWENKQITCGSVVTGPNEACGTTPVAPVAPDCSDQGNHCSGEAYKTGCTGTKLATDNNCASKATVCAGTYYGTYNGCGDSRGCLGTKDCTPAPVIKWKVTTGIGACNITTGRFNCTSGTDSSFTFETQAECADSSGCDIPVCGAGDKRCSGNNAQICRADGSDWTNTDCGTLGCNATTKVCNVCTPGAKQCSGTTARVCRADGSDWTDTACGVIGCNATTKVCNVCTPGNQKCSTSNDYFTCTSSGTWTSTKTDCSSGKICTNLQEGTNVCTEPAYAAPKINLLFAIFGVNSNATLPCLGDNKFTVTIYKDGVIGGIKTDNVVATPVSIGTTIQVFKISNFQLSNNIALTDKIKISIGGRKTLAIIYGKNNQESGFPATSASQILVSSLVTDNNLNLYKFPLLNGDIGSAGNIGVKDNVIDGIDFAHMSNQWNKRCTAGQNLESDLNGDCYVDGLDLQIYKKALEKQYSQ